MLTTNLNKASTILANKFRNQTAKINSESMKIAAKYKINPLFSLATLIVQAPVFFSLYIAVTNLSVPVGSILIPWISNVHLADNFHVLPVVGALLQTLGIFTAENKNLLMFILPVVIGVVFLWKAPVALSAYWIVNSVLRFVEIKIFQLSFIQRKYFNIPSPEEMVQRIIKKTWLTPSDPQILSARRVRAFSIFISYTNILQFCLGFMIPAIEMRQCCIGTKLINKGIFIDQNRIR